MSTEKIVTIKPRWWDDATFQVKLSPHAHHPDEWEVFTLDGSHVGTVTRYEGSLDRKLAGTRLRSPGKRRTLWAYRSPGSGYTMWEQYSRADCIRSLVDSHRRAS